MTAGEQHQLPLEGVRVIDLTRLLPGPFCTQLLGDFGADVIKVEDTAVGDLTRLVPPYLGGSHSAAFLALNRNKRSLALDLKQERGREVLLRLVRQADVLVEGFRPGVMERLGLGWERLRAHNPRLVYCALTGFGHQGPWQQRPGHDINYLALGGALAISGAADGPPQLPGVQVADLTGALYAAVGILLALRARERTGQGQFVDVAMTDGVLALLSIHAAAALAGAPPRRGRGPLGGSMPNYGVYATRDGRYLAVGALEPKFWQALCSAIGRPDLQAAAPVMLAGMDEQAAAAIRAELARLFASRTLAQWQQLFAEIEACVTPVLEVEEALASEHARARVLVREQQHPELGALPQLAPVPRLDATPGTLRRHPPAHGEHTAAILEELGYRPEEIAALRAAGAVR
ncbi:MAG: CoA transferase [Planctomycetota bacterium]|nr:MAG: CoA transferase [Planctomycetota bacterium]